VTHLLLHYGLFLLFALIAIESAGIPIPGETALVIAGFLASQGHWGIEWVIVVAATGAVVGDNIGYWLGRFGGRKLLERWEFTRRYAEKALPPSERFFAKHGGKTVFLGRFIAFLRVTAAWLAGISRMHWWEFAAWNAAGGIIWATGIGLVAYYFGKAAADAIGRYGLYAALVLVTVGVLAVVGMHFWKKRLADSA
jgi:membrane protein DedA with SNARE-associated domain